VRFNLLSLLFCVLMGVVAAVFLGVFVPRQVEQAKRISCSNNLRAIGAAVRQYRDDHGQLPRVRFDAAAPAPTWGTPYRDRVPARAATQELLMFAPDDDAFAEYRPSANDVSAALYLLVRVTDLLPITFICPSTTHTPLRFAKGESPASWTNWPVDAHGVPQHLSYSYDNPYHALKGPQDRVKLVNIAESDVPLVSDMNPGVDSLLTLSLKSSRPAIRRANSRNHAGEGQNVVFLDGSVQFNANPFCGVQRDNIFTASGREIAERDGPTTIVGPPENANDAVMLPAARER
jgi:type II secretory pathway pseudopilin PulG